MCPGSDQQPGHSGASPIDFHRKHRAASSVYSHLCFFAYSFRARNEFLFLLDRVDGSLEKLCQALAGGKRARLGLEVAKSYG